MAARLNRVLAGLWPGASGPAVASLFQRLLALVFLGAWISLGWQIRLLVGERGLMPLWAFLDQAGELPWLAYPSLLRWQALATDGALVGGTLLGAALAVLALFGVRPRLCFALSTALYLGYAAACRTFLAFQWDNLLLECGFLAAFLRADRPAPALHLLFRLVAFKLYFESGIAKWQSPIKDWHDGSAMTYYYETAPLPTALAWYAHNLPAWWHHLESRATLVLELVLPFGIFGPRPVRLATAGAFTGFQAANMATANYGFFVPLSLALHVFWLDDRDVPGRLRRLLRVAPEGEARPLRWWAAAGVAAWCLLSLLSAGARFGAARWVAWAAPVRRVVEPLRLVNTYHLFASITRERIEPELQALVQGAWRPLELRHKAGDPARAPGFVAPHQPRVDFQLWFHGLGYQGGQPLYLAVLLRRLCDDRPAVRPLFRAPLPRDPEAVRVAYWRYHFTSPGERRATGAWWRRTLVETSAPLPCER